MASKGIGGSGGMKAAQAAAKEPVAMAQAIGAKEVSKGERLDGTAMRAVEIPTSSLPVQVSGLRSDVPSWTATELPQNLEEIQQYLTTLYPFTTPDPEDGYWQSRSQLVDASGDVSGM